MHILLIGERTLFIDSVNQFLSQEDDFEISRLSYHELDSQGKNERIQRSEVGILDLLSLSANQVKRVQVIAQQDVCDHLVVLHNNLPDEHCESIYEAGADYCVPMDTDSDELLSLVRDCIKAD